jgi:hypothetical protein
MNDTYTLLGVTTNKKNEHFWGMVQTVLRSREGGSVGNGPCLARSVVKK